MPRPSREPGRQGEATSSAVRIDRPRMAFVQQRIRCGCMKDGLADIGPEATSVSALVASDRRAHEERKVTRWAALLQQ